MKQVILSLFFVITGTFLFAQTPKAYALNDSLAATENNKKSLTYLASYLPLMDSISRLKKGIVALLPALVLKKDSLTKEVDRRQTMVDSIAWRVKSGEDLSKRFQKNCFARLEETKRALRVNANELDSIQTALQKWNYTYSGLAFLSRVFMMNLLGSAYEEVVKDMDFDEIFTLKGKTIFIRRHLETYCF